MINQQKNESLSEQVKNYIAYLEQEAQPYIELERDQLETFRKGLKKLLKKKDEKSE